MLTSHVDTCKAIGIAALGTCGAGHVATGATLTTNAKRAPSSFAVPVRFTGSAAGHVVWINMLARPLHTAVAVEVAALAIHFTGHATTSSTFAMDAQRTGFRFALFICSARPTTSYVVRTLVLTSAINATIAICIKAICSYVALL